jgi:hypothetical protein
MTKVLELLSYGLTGLAATVVIAFSLAYVDELDRGRKTLFDLPTNADLEGHRMIWRWARALGFGRAVREQPEVFPESFSLNKSVAETSSTLSAAIANKNACGPLERSP